MSVRNKHTFYSLLGSVIITAICLIYTAIPHVVSESHEDIASEIVKDTQERELREPYVHIDLQAMNVTLYGTSSVEAIFPIVSKGKPGSYYETPGGRFVNDYKEPLHFSSIGHVFMPSSVHIFGNFFIHGIPYYPDGTRVSSTYSGGCIRLADTDAAQVYDFIKPGMVIIIAENATTTFKNQSLTVTSEQSSEMTRYMAALVSLEFLTQDNPLLFEGVTTTRRTLLPRLLLEEDASVASFFARSMGREAFVETMNTKAKSMGLGATTFTDETSAALTSKEDYLVFVTYIKTYASYLLALPEKPY